jgi:serine/threonine kinase PknH
MLSRGDLLGGYEIEDLLGIGGMAIVYRARQRSLGGRQVALKVLAPERSSDESFRERFRREGEHAAQLDHPHIVPVYDAGEADGQLYLAMRLIEGETLAHRISRGPLAPGETIALLRPVADALDLAHAENLVHRDVKPQNILLDTRGRPYLADFGIAKSSSALSLTDTGMFVGSIQYASPEQILGDEPASSSDVYALTAVLYQCLAGQVPYPYDTDVRILGAHISQAPPTFSQPGPDWLRSVDHVVARGMAKDPLERYPTASALVEAAAEAITFGVDEREPRLAATRLSVPRPAPPPRTTAPVRRPPAVPDAPELPIRRRPVVDRVLALLDAGACRIAGLQRSRLS